MAMCVAIKNLDLKLKSKANLLATSDEEKRTGK